MKKGIKCLSVNPLITMFPNTRLISKTCFILLSSQAIRQIKYNIVLAKQIFMLLICNS